LTSGNTGRSARYYISDDPGDDPGVGQRAPAKMMLSRRSLLGLVVLTGVARPRPPAATDPPRGADYVVAPTGDDDRGNGSLAAPWASLERAYAVALPGDTIHLRGGSYLLGGGSGIHLTGRSGAPGRSITIRNYRGERPILDGSRLASTVDSYGSAEAAGGYVLSLYDVSHLVLRGLEIRNAPMGGLVVRSGSLVNGGCHHNRFENLSVRDSGWGGHEGKGIALFGFARNNVFVNCDSFGNADLDGGNADGFQISPVGSGSTGNVLVGCRAWHNSDDGFDLFNVNDNTAPAPLLLYRCWAWANGFRPDGARSTGEGHGFKLGGQRDPARGNKTGLSGGHTVSGCASWSNALSGFTDSGSAVASRVSRCTAYDNGRSRDGNGQPADTWTRGFYFPTSAGHRLIDNVSFLPRGREAVVGPGNAGEGNSWDSGPPVRPTDFLSLADATATGPRQPDGSLPATTFLHSAPGSRLARSGIGLNGDGEEAGAAWP
jgi:hypothetical protein